MAEILSTLRIARKAGRLELGDEQVGAACRASTAKLVLVANDAAENTFSRATHFSGFAKRHCVTVPHTKAEIGKALGTKPVAMIAVCDTGFARVIAERLAQDNPQRFADAVEDTTRLDESARRRAADKKNEERNKRFGKH